MDIEEFRVRGKQMIDYICKYYENLPKEKVYPDVQPGFLARALPSSAPEKGEDWEKIMKDTDNIIMKGITHWQHPNFYAYFCAGASFPSILGTLLADGLGIIPFSWSASPACTELENLVLDWLCRAFKLPNAFLSTSTGGGVINASASDNILNCVIAARSVAIEKLRKGDKSIHGSVFLPKLIAYCSADSHSSTLKAVKLAMIKLVVLPTDENNTLRGKTLEDAIKRDIEKGLLPMFLSCTFGTTSTCAIDHTEELGPICKKYGLWMHLDAAYAGASLICPEIREKLKGLEYVDTITINMVKWGLVNVDCACLWVRNKEAYCAPFIIDPFYLKDCDTFNLNYDYRHWGVALTKRFRSLKLWYMMRTYGLEGMRSYQRNHMKLAKYAESLLEKDPLFEIMSPASFGMVCFKLARQGNEKNQQFLKVVNSSRKLHMIPTKIKENYAIRFPVCSEHACTKDIDTAISVLKECAEQVLVEELKYVKENPRTSLDFTMKVELDDYVKYMEKKRLLDMVNPLVVARESV